MLMCSFLADIKFEEQKLNGLIKIYFHDRPINVPIKPTRPTPIETRKFLYFKLIKYCRAIIGKQVMKNFKLPFKKYMIGIPCFGN